LRGIVGPAEFVQSIGLVMSNSTLLRADRATHLKIVVISVLAAFLVIGVGVTAKPPGNGALQIEDNGLANKPGKPVSVTSRETGTIR
jgi:hypothetical protein